MEMKNKLSFLKSNLALLTFLFLTISFENGCIPIRDYYEDLSGNYFYCDEGKNDKEILCNLPNHIEIYSKVIGYNYNSDFILAEQQPIYSEFKAIIGSKLRENKKKYPANSMEEVIQSETVADSILLHDPFYKAIFVHSTNYWIIDNKIQKVFGPLTKEDYENKRKELSVPENLKIRYDL